MGIMAGIQENEVEATILTSYDLASQNYINNLRKHQKSNKSTKKNYKLFSLPLHMHLLQLVVKA
jgi:hypothetical protein